MNISPILEHVYVSGMEDCDKFAPLGKGNRLNVMYPYQLCGVAICYPADRFLQGFDPRDPRGYDPSACYVLRDDLDAVAARIDNWSDKPLLVHCAQGIERAPLAVAWWPHRYRGYSLNSAYALLRQRRPIVQDRRFWIR